MSVFRALPGWVLLAAALALPARAAELVVGTGHSSLSLPLFVAEAQGYFAAEGVVVRSVPCLSGDACMRLLTGVAGKAAPAVQLTTASDLVIALAAFDAPGLAVVATMATSSTNIRIVGRRGAGVGEAAATLAGKRIGIVTGASSHYYLDAVLLASGIDPRQAALVPLAREQLVPALVARRIDAFAGYTAIAAAALAELGGDGVALEQPRLYSERFNLVAERGALASHGADVVKLLRALARAQRFIAEQPQQALAVLKARMKADGPQLQAVFDGTHFRLTLDASLVSTMESQGRWALREGQVAAGRALPDYRRFVEPGPLRKAVPAALLP